MSWPISQVLDRLGDRPSINQGKCGTNWQGTLFIIQITKIKKYPDTFHEVEKKISYKDSQFLF